VKITTSGTLGVDTRKWVSTMKHLFAWLAVPLLLIGAAMLIGGVGATALWIAVITVGIALVAIDGNRHRHERHSG
jgi:hypothetical protein